VDQFRRVLEIDIHYDDGITAGVFHAGECGHGLAEAPAKISGA